MNTQTSLNTDRWRVLCNRQPQDDFYYAVLTTGVVCRTGCPSRLPRRENVRFYDSLAAAYQDGYRPCRRCLDRDEQQALVAGICSSLDEDSRIADVAHRHGISERQLQRLFKTVLGISPKQFQIEARIKRFLERVRMGERITDAAYAAGFPSTSRLHEQLKARTGLSPREHRERGNGVPVFYATESTSLGTLILAQTLKGLCFAGFYPERSNAEAALAADLPQSERIPVLPDQLEPIHSAFNAALSGDFDALRQLPLDVRGTVFQRAVWRAARQIEPGARIAYGELARRIDRPEAVRAVAGALGRNRIALAIPCHRVVPSGQRDQGGYRWGRERKAALLAAESS